MLKLIMCDKRRPGMTREEFDRHWIEHHAPLVHAHRDLLGIKRYTQTVTLADPEAQNRIRASRGTETVDSMGAPKSGLTTWKLTSPSGKPQKARGRSSS